MIKIKARGTMTKSPFLTDAPPIQLPQEWEFERLPNGGFSITRPKSRGFNIKNLIKTLKEKHNER